MAKPEGERLICSLGQVRRKLAGASRITRADELAVLAVCTGDWPDEEPDGERAA